MDHFQTHVAWVRDLRKPKRWKNEGEFPCLSDAEDYLLEYCHGQPHLSGVALPRASPEPEPERTKETKVMNALVDLLVKLLAPLDGRKSYVGAALIGLAAVLALFPATAGIAPLLHQLGVALMGVGIAHKLQKCMECQALPVVDEPVYEDGDDPEAA